MTSRLLSPNPQIRAQQRQRSQQNTPLAAVRAQPPWPGYEPDRDPSQASPGSMGPGSLGLVARPDPSGRGEVLMPDEGFVLLDSTGLPGQNMPLGLDAATTNDITLITQWDRTNSVGARTGVFDLTPFAISAGDAATVTSCEVWGLDPNINRWVKIAFIGSGTEAQGGREDLFDACQMPSGAPARSIGNIAEPAIVFCNGADLASPFSPDQVYIAPHQTSATGYEALTTVAALDPFYSQSVETFNSRVYFLNTNENGTHHRQRLRWTALFTADPIPTDIGAGALDFREFAGNGLRAETLGNVLACYFSDGVAFVRPTGVSTAPVARQILTTQRGLIGTFAVTQVPDHGHFGIFTDGWFFLDPSGRWTEVGRGRWKRDFYARLDENNRHRLYVHYRQPNNRIYIAYPSIDSTDIEEVWIYDIQEDRVWLDKYPGGPGAVTCFGDIDSQIAAGTAWNAASLTQSWATIVGSWASFGARFGTTAMVHGGHAGYPMVHNPDVITRVRQENVAYASLATINDNWRFRSHLSNLGRPGKLATSDRVSMEYIDVNGPNATFQVFGNPTDGSQSATVDFPAATLGDTRSIHRNIRLTGENLGIDVSGTTPVLIRSIGGDFWLWDVEPRV